MNDPKPNEENRTTSAPREGGGRMPIPAGVIAAVVLGLAAAGGLVAVQKSRAPERSVVLQNFASYADAPDWLAKKRAEPGVEVAPGVRRGHFKTAWETWPGLDTQTRRCIQSLAVPENELDFF